MSDERSGRYISSKETWTAVDDYICETLVPSDEALEAALRESAAAGLPQISVAPNQGKLLYLLARLQGARNILELGTLGGYSTIWLARALPADGRLITLEAEAKHAEVARKNIERAGMGDRVEVRVGPALEALPRLVEERRGPFDLVFIDADKPNVPDYFMWSMKLVRRGSLIIIDNVIQSGAVADAGGDNASVHGLRRMNELIAAEGRVSATTIQTVGVKGYDGLTMVLVTGEV
jgi:predicted O-methyltransferase YrrM